MSIDSQKGLTKWRFKPKDKINLLKFSDNLIYILSKDGFFRVFEKKSGRLLWDFEIDIKKENDIRIESYGNTRAIKEEPSNIFDITDGRHIMDIYNVLLIPSDFIFNSDKIFLYYYDKLVALTFLSPKLIQYRACA
ncbi:hypothetical protein D1AOALGA4SA_3429 [Olavius algarvensis Delta 1 endosymbiont]|nr:hypothetical protein D1AOALGA4SA_3429 [Olavius algarvensis Delta 1 endosymbiont]